MRRISPYSVRMRENMDQEKLRIRALFKQWLRNDCFETFRQFTEKYGNFQNMAVNHTKKLYKIQRKKSAMEPLFIKTIDLHPTPLLKKTQRLYHQVFSEIFQGGYSVEHL